MKHLLRGIAALLIFVGVLAHAQPAPGGIQAPSTWTNQGGSTLYIDSVGTSGQITGRYINRVPNYKCQGISYPVTGWLHGNAITFTTLWQSATESCNSITAWTGFYNEGQITTLWQLVVNGYTKPDQILQGNAIFSRP